MPRSDQDLAAPSFAAIYSAMSDRKPVFKEVPVGGAKPRPETPLPAEAFVVPAKLDPRASAPAKDEIGGYDGPEPTRFGDWEHKGRCTDF